MKRINYLVLFCATALMAVSCTKGLGWEEENNGDKPNPGSGKLVLTADKLEIEADGIDAATLIVTKGGVSLPTSYYTIYDENNRPVSLVDNKFTTTTVGEYTFWASDNSSISEDLTIKAVKPTVDPNPDNKVPDDPNQESLDFKRRVMMIQFTGTGCQYCPRMITMLNEMVQAEGVKSNYVLVAAHRYNSDDPMYLRSAALDYMVGVSDFPSLNYDFHNTSITYDLAYNQRIFESELNRVKARGGISASSSYDSSTRTVTLTAAVKAAEEHNFRIGAWLIEDNIIASQTNYDTPGDWSNYAHHNSIRYCDSKRSAYDFSGYDLGTIAKGETAEHAFEIKLDETWNEKYCRLVVFIATQETIGTTRRWYINNVVKVPLNGTVSYEYNE